MLCVLLTAVLLQHLRGLYDLKEQTVLTSSRAVLNEISSLTVCTYRLLKQSSTSAPPSAGKTHTFKCLIQHSWECQCVVRHCSSRHKKQKKGEHNSPPLPFFSVLQCWPFCVAGLCCFSHCRWVIQPHKTASFLSTWTNSTGKTIDSARHSLIKLIALPPQDNSVVLTIRRKTGDTDADRRPGQQRKNVSFKCRERLEMYYVVGFSMNL